MRLFKNWATRLPANTAEISNDAPDGDTATGVTPAQAAAGPDLLKRQPPRQLLQMKDVPPSYLHIGVVGNCQAAPIAAYVQALGTNIVANSLMFNVKNNQIDNQLDTQYRKFIGQHDYIIVQSYPKSIIELRYPEIRDKLILIPVITFSGFHPDIIYVQNPETKQILVGPLGQYNSALALFGFLNELSIAETVNLFNDEIYDWLGYYEYFQSSRKSLIDEGRSADFPLEGFFDGWVSRGSFMHSINHPKPCVFADLAGEILAKLGVPVIREGLDATTDALVNHPIWPVYPEIGRRFGIFGSYNYKVHNSGVPGHAVRFIGLEQFVAQSFREFGRWDKGDLAADRLKTTAFKGLAERLKTGGTVVRRQAQTAPPDEPAYTAKAKRNPYSDLPAHQFWRKSIEMPPSAEVDPVVRTKFGLTPEHKVATAGSCFAQHIARTLRRAGFNYYVTEQDPTLPAEEAIRQNYGVFSARYGNVYTVRQMTQLIERAYGRFTPQDSAWRRPDGKFADPFRPQISPDGFDSVEAVDAGRALHLRAVREMLERMDVLVFTLGLTEGWRAKVDGAVFPLAPGVAAGEMDGSLHEFVNFTSNDVAEDLARLRSQLDQINPRAKVILTVSPVPLVATYEPRHVLVATTYSKAVLRVAADERCRQHENWDYFPSYEIITGNYNRGAYYDNDLRSVKPEGVDHVMRLFLKHFAGRTGGDIDAELNEEFNAIRAIVCDEEAIAR